MTNAVPMNRFDKRDECVCGHSWYQHQYKTSGACIADFCRCKGFWKERKSMFSFWRAPMDRRDG